MVKETETMLQRIANSVFVVVASRAAMIATPLMITGLVTIGSMYLAEAQGRSRDVVNSIMSQLMDVQVQSAKLTAAVNELKGQQLLLVERGANSLNWQVSTNSRLDKMTDSITSLSNSLAALNATVQLLR